MTKALQDLWKPSGVILSNVGEHGRSPDELHITRVTVSTTRRDIENASFIEHCLNEDQSAASPTLQAMGAFPWVGATTLERYSERMEGTSLALG